VAKTTENRERAETGHAEPRAASRVTRTTCAVVGGGPGGAVLALLLARKGIDVTLLEAHPDFDREFRGDTLHPSVMEIMDQLGLADRLLELRHSKVGSFTIQTDAGPFTPATLSRLRTRFPYITIMPQTSFLEFIVGEAEKYPSFRVVMGARVKEFVEEDGVVRGVRYEGEDGAHEVRAALVVGADGRGSRVRRLAGIEPVKTSPPMDVLWFKLPREPEDAEGIVGRFGRGHIAVMLDRDDHWQAGYVIPKGTFPELRHEGVGELRRQFAELVPEFADRLEHLTDWRKVSLLSVESSRCPTWHSPGLLLIGDAAHVMSPVAGVGINYAIQDAVSAANILAGPLRESQSRSIPVDEKHLAAVQRRRELPTKVIQAVQAQVQKNVLAPALGSSAAFSIPLPLRLLPKVPLLRDIPGRLIGYGVWPSRVKV
jgi:2-polyprenyl-6-methoxyphenol hydroxylase-like FAD-dependent oxidoreductase